MRVNDLVQFFLIRGYWTSRPPEYATVMTWIIYYITAPHFGTNATHITAMSSLRCFFDICPYAPKQWIQHMLFKCTHWGRRMGDFPLEHMVCAVTCHPTWSDQCQWMWAGSFRNLPSLHFPSWLHCGGQFPNSSKHCWQEWEVNDLCTLLLTNGPNASFNDHLEKLWSIYVTWWPQHPILWVKERLFTDFDEKFLKVNLWA